MRRKKAYTILVSVLSIILLTLIIWWGYTNLSQKEVNADIDLYTLVPSDSKAILESKDFSTLQKNIHSSHFTEEYGLLHVSDLLNDFISYLENVSKQQAHGLSSEMSSQILVSFHHPNTTQDQVIYGRLGKNDKQLITDLINNHTTSKHSPKQLTYKGETITIYSFGKEFLACYFKPGFFAISLQEKLIEKVIDAYKEDSSIKENKSFNTLKNKNKHNEQLSLYFQTNNSIDTWNEYEIRMNSGAIYITGGYVESNITNLLTANLITHTSLERIDDTDLPNHVQIMYQIPFTPNNNNFSNNTTNHTLENLLTIYDCQELDLIMFSPKGGDDIAHQLIMMPLPENQMEDFKLKLRTSPYIYRKPSLWIKGIAHSVWQCTKDSILQHYFIQHPQKTDYFLSVYKNKLLISDKKESILHYLTEVTDNTTNHQLDKYTNKILYTYCLNDLAENANFTFVADMNDIINHCLNSTTPTPLLPDFFMKHKDFFKHFMLSIQLINTDGQINSQIILTYRGDIQH